MDKGRRSSAKCHPLVKIRVPRYQEIPEPEWPKVENWFKVQIERAKEK
jgi:hypothetical protein